MDATVFRGDRDPPCSSCRKDDTANDGNFYVVEEVSWSLYDEKEVVNLADRPVGAPRWTSGGTTGVRLRILFDRIDWSLSLIGACEREPIAAQHGRHLRDQGVAELLPG